MSGGGGYSLGGGGGRVKEPTVTFKRPLRIHSETENLIGQCIYLILLFIMVSLS